MLCTTQHITPVLMILQLEMMGPILPEVEWKPSLKELISGLLPSLPGTGSGARFTFLHVCTVEKAPLYSQPSRLIAHR